MFSSRRKTMHGCQPSLLQSQSENLNWGLMRSHGTSHMNSILKHLHLFIFFAISTPAFFCSGEDLIKQADGMVRYKLSNFRVNTGITGDGMSFDYRRTSEGKGQAKLRIRTNQGSASVMGLPIQIKESGTINLRDMFGRARSIINRNQDDGIAFYFVVDLG